MINPKLIRIDHYEVRHRAICVVDWCLSNICNYECSYCPSSLHNGTSTWPSLRDAMLFSKRVIDHYDSFGYKVFFHFTGGEPTLYRNLAELLCFIKGNSGLTGIISNGSPGNRRWGKITPYLDAVVLTYHVEFGNEIEFYQLLGDLTSMINIKIHVNVTMLPERFDECLSISHNIVSLFPSASVTLKPLLINFQSQLFSYNQNQLDTMRSFMPPNAISTLKEGARGAMQLTYDDNSIKLKNASDFITMGENNWMGWLCNAGIESLCIDQYGNVFRAICKQEGKIGHIHDANLELPNRSVKCQSARCSCISDIMITKWNGE